VTEPGSSLASETFATLLVRALAVGAPGLLAVLSGFVFLLALAGGNPVVSKEFRTRAMGRMHWMLRLIGVCLIVSLGLALLAAQWAADQPDKAGYLGGLLVVFQMALVVLITPALSAGLISVELESGGWQLLQVTRLSTRQIIFGKLLSVATTLVLLLAATVPGYFVLLAIDRSLFMQRVLDVLACLGLTSLFALLLGAACSSLFRKTAVTTTIAYLILVGLCVGTLSAWLGEGILFAPSLVERVLAFNPVAAALSAMKMPGFDQYDLLSFNWWFLAIASAACTVVLWGRVWWLNRPK